MTDTQTQENQVETSPAEQTTTNDESLLNTDANPSIIDFSSETRPDNLDERFWDNENGRPNINAIWHAKTEAETLASQEKQKALGLRQKLSGGEHKPSDNIDDYKIEIPEEHQELIGGEDDIVLNSFYEVAQKKGLSPHLTKEIVTDLLPIMNEAMQSAQQDILDGEDFAGQKKQELQKLGDNANQRINALNAGLSQLPNYVNTISKESIETIRQNITNADMVVALEQLVAGVAGNNNVTPVVSQNDAHDTKAKAQKLYMRAYEENNPALAEEADRIMSRIR